MPRAVLFLSRFLLSLWIVLVSAFLGQLLSNAPNAPGIPLASVSINTGGNSTVYLPNRLFNCTGTEQQFQCQTEIQERQLSLSFTQGSDYSNYPYDLGVCSALYDGQEVSCRQISDWPILGLSTYEIRDLGFSQKQLQAEKQKYWGINLLLELGEPGLSRISTGLSLVGAICVALFAWFHPGLLSKTFTSFACGFGMYLLVWELLGSVLYSVARSYGFAPNIWGWIVNGVAIATGAGTMLATFLLLWRRFNPLTQILFMFSNSIGIFAVSWLSLNLNFADLPGFLGLSATFFLLSKYVLMGFSLILAIAAIILLSSETVQFRKIFLCFVSGFGTAALARFFFLVILLDLGYAD